ILLAGPFFAAFSPARLSSVTAAICDESHVSRLGSSNCTCPISLRYMRTGSSAMPMVSMRESSTTSSSDSSASSSESTTKESSSPPSETTSMPISSSCSYMVWGLSDSGSSKSSMTSVSASSVGFSRCGVVNASSDGSSWDCFWGRFAIVISNLGVLGCPCIPALKVAEKRSYRFSKRCQYAELPIDLPKPFGHKHRRHPVPRPAVKTGFQGFHAPGVVCAIPILSVPAWNVAVHVPRGPSESGPAPSRVEWHPDRCAWAQSAVLCKWSSARPGVLLSRRRDHKADVPVDIPYVPDRLALPLVASSQRSSGNLTVQNRRRTAAQATLALTGPVLPVHAACDLPTPTAEAVG